MQGGLNLSRVGIRSLVVLAVVLIAGFAFFSHRQANENSRAAVAYTDPGDSGLAAANTANSIAQHDPTASVVELRDPDIPDLPFPDNPDPNQCGIPAPWGKDQSAWLNGYYEGKLVEPVVFLYDSHNRLKIKARAPHGSEVKVLLYQNNPVVDYYLVKVVGLDGPANEGWIPSPFLSFEPVDALPSGGRENAGP